MNNTPTCNWIGKSGNSYKYHIYKLPPNFKNASGNYIFTKLNTNNKWVPIYIGETKDLSERFDDHHKMPCIKRKGVTHIHAHLNQEGEVARRQEESDLLDNYQNAKEPSGCNG